MPTLQFKGKPLVQNHHLVVPFSEIDPIKKLGLSKTPSLHDNLIIEGDNLKALKALLPTYHGKVKCIYIDPPYNTGNEGWIYNDRVNSPMMRDWLGRTVDRDDLTRHDKWCCMMLPRLKLLRELLTDDGAIFVSIDDNEVHHLRALMDEVFGEENFFASLIWRRREVSDSRNIDALSPDHDYIVAYRKSEAFRFLGKEKDLTKYQNPDNDPRGPWMSDNLTGLANKEERPNLHYTVTNPATGLGYEPHPSRGWVCSKERMHRHIEEDRILWPRSPDGRPRLKRFLSDMQNERTGFSTVLDVRGNVVGTKELSEILGSKVMAFPKPSELIGTLVRQATDKDSIILDSFAGSGTTAHAVLALNKEDSGNRRFILCQMPFETKEQEQKKENICERITAERVRRVIKGVPKVKAETLREGLGGTFSYFRLGKELRKQAILDGKDLPRYDALAGYVFFTATGEEFDPKKMNRDKWFVGTSRDRDVFLIYEEDIEKLKDMALNLDLARKLGKAERKKLVFAPTKYLDQEYLDRLNIEFCQLPFEIYQRATKK
jgi:adenine-specific DNA-methyltransferase